MAEERSTRHPRRLTNLLLAGLLLLAGAVALGAVFLAGQRHPSAPPRVEVGLAPLPAPGASAPRPAAAPAAAPANPASLLKRASAGDPAAQYALALAYAEGAGVARDYARAAAWFREAAINGVAAAQYDLGVLYERGIGLQHDPAEAMIWYESAADQNQPQAAFRLGAIYASGAPVPRNAGEAARRFRAAARQGLAEAQLALARLYAAGDGVPQALDRAYAWASLAAAAGLAPAERERNALAGELDPAARAAAPAAAARLAAEVAQATQDMPAPREDAMGLVVTPTPNPADAVVTRSMVGEIQRLLAAAAYDPGPADGVVGETTSEAIRRYQQKAGLPVDGIPDRALLARLRAAAEGPPPAARR